MFLRFTRGARERCATLAIGWLMLASGAARAQLSLPYFGGVYSDQPGFTIYNLGTGQGIYGYGQGAGVAGEGVSQGGWFHSASSVGTGVTGIADGAGSVPIGGYFVSPSGQAVKAHSVSGNGVVADSTSGWAILANGNVKVYGYVTAYSFPVSSDARLKEHIAPLVGGLGVVCSLHPVTFQWRPSARLIGAVPAGRHIGFTAQDVERVLPELVQKDRYGYRSVEYASLVPVLVKAVQEQQREIQDLRSGKDIRSPVHNPSPPAHGAGPLSLALGCGVAALGCVRRVRTAA